MYLLDRDEISILNGKISNNVANSYGGGLFLDFITNLKINNVEFNNN